MYRRRPCRGNTRGGDGYGRLRPCGAAGAATPSSCCCCCCPPSAVLTPPSQQVAPQAPQPRRRLASALTRPVNTLLVMVAVGVWKGLRRTWGRRRGSRCQEDPCLSRLGTNMEKERQAMLLQRPGVLCPPPSPPPAHPCPPPPLLPPHPQVRLIHLHEKGAYGVIRLAIMQQQQACVAGRDKGSHKQVVEAVHRLTQQQQVVQPQQQRRRWRRTCRDTESCQRRAGISRRTYCYMQLLVH